MTDGRGDNQRSREDVRNDTRLLTPLILIALIIAGGFLFFAYHGAGAGPMAAHLGMYVAR